MSRFNISPETVGKDGKGCVPEPGISINTSQAGLVPMTLRPLLEEITARTGLPIALEGIYRWIAFLSSRLDERVPVANRYFGIFQGGKIKTRGIETRRHDTPPWIAQVQFEMIKRLAKVPNHRPLTTAVPGLVTFLRQQVEDLRNGRIPLEQLLVSQRLSREIAEYRTPSPTCRAAMQLTTIGKPRRRGQRLRFWFVLGGVGVHAYDLPVGVDTAVLDLERYTTFVPVWGRSSHTPVITQPRAVVQ